MEPIPFYTVRVFDVDTLSEYQSKRLDTICQASAWYTYNYHREMGGSNYVVTYEVGDTSLTK